MTADAPAPPDLPPLDGWAPLHAGKVRQLYTATDDPDRLLVVATDRVSAYDHVLETPVPGKGALLTALSLWWFEQLAGWGVGAGSHVVGATAADGVPAAVAGRAMVCRRLEMVPVECVVRGHLAGSAWADYRATGAVGGVELPAGLVEGEALRAPLFTPTTKAAVGEHDEPMTAPAVAALVGEPLADRLREVSLGVFARASALAADRGLLLADTKLELGLVPGTPTGDPDALRAALDDGALVVGDELLTPDSSRYWPADGFAPGRAPHGVDKQLVRDWLTSDASGWHRDSGQAPPPLPDEVVERTRERYARAYEQLTGRPAPG